MSEAEEYCRCGHPRSAHRTALAKYPICESRFGPNNTECECPNGFEPSQLIEILGTARKIEIVLPGCRQTITGRNGEFSAERPQTPGDPYLAEYKYRFSSIDLAYEWITEER